MKKIAKIFIAMGLMVGLLCSCGGEGESAVAVSDATIEAAVKATVNAEVEDLSESSPDPAAISTPVPTNTSTPEPTTTPTIEPTATEEPTAEPTNTPEPTPEPSPTPLCFGEEDVFANYQSEYVKIEGSYDLYRLDVDAEYARELIAELETLTPPSCLEEYHQGLLTWNDMWADWLEDTDNQTRHDFEANMGFIEYQYSMWNLLAPLGNELRRAEYAVYGEAENPRDYYYIGIHEGNYASENFEITESCDELEFFWSAIQSNNGGYVNVELVNYETGEIHTLVDRVLSYRYETHYDGKPLKDIPAGNYFIRSTTYPTWVTVLWCERPWEE